MARQPLFATTIFLIMSFVYGQGPHLSWADSYSVGGKCYCQTTYDHGLREKKVKGPNGTLISIEEACKIAGTGPEEGRIYYNDIICGNGIEFNLNNDAGDEDWCPGRVDLGPGNEDGCNVKGPLFAWLQSRYTPTPSPMTIPTKTPAAGPTSTPTTSPTPDSFGLFQGVFLVDIESDGERQLPVTKTTSVLLADYPSGFSIRADCAMCSNVWFVAGSYSHRELEKPFFMHGNSGTKSEPWPNPSPGSVSIAITGNAAATVETNSFTLTFV